MIRITLNPIQCLVTYRPYKTYKTHGIILFLFISLCSPAGAWSQWVTDRPQWNQMYIPQGGARGADSECVPEHVGNISVVDSNHNLYVYAPGDDRSSTEQFHKWSPSSKHAVAIRIDSAQPNSRISVCLCLPNGTILAAGHKIFRSTDAGIHWTKEWTSPDSVYSLVLDPQGRLLAATSSGIYLTDATDTLWRKTLKGLPNHRDTICYVVFAAPNGSYFASYFAYTLGKSHADSNICSGFVYRSTDGGQTWTLPVRGIQGVLNFAVNARGTLLAGGVFDGMYLSSNNGQSWSRTNPSFGIAAATTWLSESPDGNMYVTTWDGGTWASSDYGMNWVPVPGLWGVHSVAVLNVAPGLLACVTDAGVFESKDHGEHWVAIDSGFTTAIVADLANNDGALYASLTRRGIIRSTDDGATWQPMNDGLLDDSYRLFGNGSQLYAKGTAAVFRLDGNLWHSLPQLDQPTISAVCVDKNGKMLAGTPNFGLWSLPKDSNTWMPAMNLFGMPIRSIVCDSGNILYALVGNSGNHGCPPGSKDSLFISKNDGHSWNVLPMNDRDTTIFAMAANWDTLCVATASALYRSRDHGKTWTAQSFGKKDDRSSAFTPIGLAFHGGHTIVFSNSEVWETESDTSPWQVNTGYEGARRGGLTSLTIGKNDIAYLGTVDDGIYSRSLIAPAPLQKEPPSPKGSKKNRKGRDQKPPSSLSHMPRTSQSSGKPS